MPATLGEIAAAIGAECPAGSEGVVITGVAGVRDARPGDIAFVAQTRYAADAAVTAASALIVSADWDRPSPAALLRVAQPEAAFAKVALRFAAPPPVWTPGVHPTAVVDASARVGGDVHIGPHCVVQPGAVLGDRTVLVAGCYIGHGVHLGADCRLYAGVSVREHCRLGDRVIVHDGTVIGSDGFGYDVDKQGVRHKIPQIGIVDVADDVEIGANVTIDRARFGRTRIGRGVKIDNLVMIAHNVCIGDHSVIVAQAGIAGSTTLGTGVIMAGQSGAAGHVRIGDRAVVGGRGGVTKDVPAGAYVFGFPAEPHDEAAKYRALIHRLPSMREKLAALEARLAALERTSGSGT